MIFFHGHYLHLNCNFVKYTTHYNKLESILTIIIILLLFGLLFELIYNKECAKV